MTLVSDTLARLAEASHRSKSCLVAYSGGKDSLAVLDLCCRSFEHVEAFHMHFVPGLRCVEDALSYARERWSVKIHSYPHWVTSRLMRNEVFCFSHWRTDEVPEWKLADVYALAMADTGIEVLATGAKKADSLWRRRQLGTWGDRSDTVYPLLTWNKLDVLGYLRARGIPVPSSSAKAATGVDLSEPSLLWLRDTYPDDFARVCEVFPLAEAVVYRRKWYGEKTREESRAPR